jgi:hypothetical protein
MQAVYPETLEQDGWRTMFRPGYFGRRRDQRIATYNATYGAGNWRLAWVVNGRAYSFVEACKLFYEQSYYRWLADHPEEVDFICSFGECIDNAPSNVLAGRDYAHQESYSTHIQDIAVRNVLYRLGREFEGPADSVLVIRSADSNGYRFGPGNIPFYVPELITQPEICPRWANSGSVEAFWQSTKMVQVRQTVEAA